MRLPPFRLEEYFATREFALPHNLCASDAESFTMQEVLELADKETREAWENLSLGYTETKGLPLLREEIAGLYKGCSGDDVLCFAGAEEGIFCTLESLLQAGDHVIVITPSYESLLNLPKARAEVTEVPLVEEGWRLDLEGIAGAVRPNTRMIVTNFPHNPTGAVPSLEEWESLIGLAKSRDLYLFSDEVYRYMEREQRPLPSACELYEKGITLGVLSKAWGLPGLRIGWITSRDEKARKAISAMRHYTSICNSAPSEVLAVIALRNRETLVGRNLDVMRSNYPLIEAFIERHSSLLSWTPPKGGCIGLVRYHGPRSVDNLLDVLAEQEGVLLLPGTVYGVPGHFRIGFGRRGMPKALERFGAFLFRQSGDI